MGDHRFFPATELISFFRGLLFLYTISEAPLSTLADMHEWFDFRVYPFFFGYVSLLFM